jgi:hypothetical protein
VGFEVGEGVGRRVRAIVGGNVGKAHCGKFDVKS